MSFLTLALDEALKLFGTYSYEDKGPDEVMFVDPLVERLCALPASEVKVLMDDLLTHEHGERLHDTLWTRLIEDDTHPEAETLGDVLVPPAWASNTPERIEVDLLNVSDVFGRRNP